MFPENLAYNYIIWKSKCYLSQSIWIIKIHINVLSQNTARPAIYLRLKLYFQGIASFIALSSEYNICVAISEKILRNAKTEDFDRIIERLSSKHNARGVIIFVDED